ncbi:MAG: hypothetical protein LBT37_06080 [Lactobacillaceae bacterium]|jgi:hypothetical protein|nr:hypothetical protein [Lactobacillaceae bacterium]
MKVKWLNPRFLAEEKARTGSNQFDEKNNRIYVGIFDEETNWFVPLEGKLTLKAPKDGVFETPFKNNNPHLKRPGLNLQKAIYITDNSALLDIKNTVPKLQYQYIENNILNLERQFTKYTKRILKLPPTHPNVVMSTIPFYPEGIERLIGQRVDLFGLEGDVVKYKDPNQLEMEQAQMANGQDLYWYSSMHRNVIEHQLNNEAKQFVPDYVNEREHYGALGFDEPRDEDDFWYHGFGPEPSNEIINLTPQKQIELVNLYKRYGERENFMQSTTNYLKVEEQEITQFLDEYNQAYGDNNMAEKIELKTLAQYKNVGDLVEGVYSDLEQNLETMTNGDLRATRYKDTDREVEGLIIYGVDGDALDRGLDFGSRLGHIDGDELAMLGEFLTKYNVIQAEQEGVKIPDEMLLHVNAARYATDADEFHPDWDFQKEMMTSFLNSEIENWNANDSYVSLVTLTKEIEEVKEMSTDQNFAQPVSLYHESDALTDTVADFYTENSMLSMSNEMVFMKQTPQINVEGVDGIQELLETSDVAVGNWYIKPNDKHDDFLLIEPTLEQIQDRDQIYREIAEHDVANLMEIGSGNHVLKHGSKLEYVDIDDGNLDSTYNGVGWLKERLLKEPATNPEDCVTPSQNKHIQVKEVAVNEKGNITFTWENDQIEEVHHDVFAAIGEDATYDRHQSLVQPQYRNEDKSVFINLAAFTSVDLEQAGIMTSSAVNRNAKMLEQIQENAKPMANVPTEYDVDSNLEPSEFSAMVSSFQKYSNDVEKNMAEMLVYGDEQGYAYDPEHLAHYWGKDIQEKVITAMIEDYPDILKDNFEDFAGSIKTNSTIDSENKRVWTLTQMDFYPQVDEKYDGTPLVEGMGNMVDNWDELMSNLTSNEVAKQIEYSDLKNDLVESMAGYIKYTGVSKLADSVNKALEEAGETARIAADDWIGYSQGESGSILVRTSAENLESVKEYTVPELAAWVRGDETFMSEPQVEVANNQQIVDKAMDI